MIKNLICDLEDKIYDWFISIISSHSIRSVPYDQTEITNLLNIYNHIITCDLHSEYFNLKIEEIIISKSKQLNMMRSNISYLYDLNNYGYEEINEFGDGSFETEIQN